MAAPGWIPGKIFPEQMTAHCIIRLAFMYRALPWWLCFRVHKRVNSLCSRMVTLPHSPTTSIPVSYTQQTLLGRAGSSKSPWVKRVSAGGATGHLPRDS